ncbi:MAG: AAA family ATPase [Planctomycetota bacterium]|jgi:MoxR-like ATPase
MSDLVTRLRSNLNAVIRGKSEQVDFLITAFLAGGNVLLNDVPGVGKTTLAKTIARSIDGIFHRIQFTPDLLPADILGGSIYNPREGTFAFRKGPVFANILLADEINRASPRTQSSLLEAMAEGQVSIEGETYALPDPFWVIATQNPVEFHGTYPLPEAQLDRFAMQLTMGYPDREEEVQIFTSMRDRHPLEAIEAVTTPDEIIRARHAIHNIHVDEDVSRYIVEIVAATREEPRLTLGVSPRGSIALHRIAQAWAYVHGSDSVTPDHVKAVGVQTLAHRLVLETKAKYSGLSKDELMTELMNKIKVPV